MQQFSLPHSHGSLMLIHNLKSHLLDHVQVIIKSTPCLRRHRNRVAGKGMVTRCPMTRPPTHGYTCQQNGLAALGRTFNTFSDNHSWAGHNHLKAILDGFTTLEEQDILSTCTDIDGQDMNWCRHERCSLTVLAIFD